MKDWDGLYAEAGRTALVGEVKAYIQFIRDEFLDAHRHGGSGMEEVRAYTGFMDQLIVKLFSVIEKKIGAGSGQGRPKSARSCVVAVGGYGRGELSPYSDIDLLFLHDSRNNKEDTPFSQVVREVLYVLWDTGCHVGHSYRTVKECLGIASDDITVLTSLIESRCLYGTDRLFKELNKNLFGRSARKEIDRFLKTKLQERDQRHKKYENSINLQEPNVKESPGCLRDYHLILWLGKVKFGEKSLKQFCDRKLISNLQLKQLVEAVDFLLRVRSELHFMASRRSDVLSFDHQTLLAERFGFTGDEQRLGVEEFMRTFYLHLNHVYSTSQVILNSYVSRGIASFFKRRHVVKTDRAFERKGGKVFLRKGTEKILKSERSLLLRVFKVCQEYNLDLSDELKQIIQADLSLIDDEFCSSQENIDNFLSILTGKNIYKTLRQMHELRVLARFVPEFEELTCHMRFDMYHMFTIDEHILLGIKYLENLKSESPLGTLVDAYKGIEQTEDLKISFFLHDFGKVGKGDHSQRSVIIAGKILKRWRISGEKRDTILFLVGKHLLMSHIAQRRNLHDHELISRFAEEVKNMDRLRKLYLLTYADLRSVGHNAWNSWTAMLLEELYMKTSNVILDRNADDPEIIKTRVMEMLKPYGINELEHAIESMSVYYLKSTALGKICDHIKLIDSLGKRKLSISLKENRDVGYTELMVCTANKRGILASITGVLTAMGLNILGAQVYTQEDDIAVDTLQVSGKSREQICSVVIDRDELERVLEDVISGKQKVDDLLAKRTSYFDFRARNVIAVPTTVEVDNTVSRRYTEIEISAEDRLGLLYSITRALLKMGMSIHMAKISTQGNTAIDTFYVVTDKGFKVYDQNAIMMLKQKILTAVEAGIPEPVN